MRTQRFLALGLVTVLALAACSKSSTTPAPSVATTAAPAPSGSGAGAAIAATEQDFKISLNPTTGAAGDTTFDVTNNGPSTHEFVVFKTDLAPESLPIKDGIVDEKGKGVTQLGVVADIAPGETKDLSLQLEPGSYVAICNLPGHYQAGMHAGFTVS